MPIATCGARGAKRQNHEPGGVHASALCRGFVGVRQTDQPTVFRGWLLERRVPHSAELDAIGTYPLFCCADWNGLHQDIDALRGRLVSLVLVADPFGQHNDEFLRATFDRVLPLKTHFAVDLDVKGPIGSRHHQYRARRALRDVEIEVCADPESKIDEWIALYNCLIDRHTLTGIQAFSPESFRRQFAVPGLVLFRAVARSGECVGAQLWFKQCDIAYSHLTVANSEGYRCACTYALYDAAIRYFRGSVRWLDLGGAAGIQQKGDGLTLFKRGWSNATRTAFLCCSILDSERYAALCNAAGTSSQDYFPSYRWREAA